MCAQMQQGIIKHVENGKMRSGQYLIGGKNVSLILSTCKNGPVRSKETWQGSKHQNISYYENMAKKKDKTSLHLLHINMPYNRM